MRIAVSAYIQTTGGAVSCYNRAAIAAPAPPIKNEEMNMNEIAQIGLHIVALAIVAASLVGVSSALAEWMAGETDHSVGE